MKEVIFLIVVLTIAGCEDPIESAKPVEPEIGEDFTLKVGQEATFADKEFVITFKKILEDSRCPKGVTCVWSGNAQILIQFNEKEFQINTHIDPETLPVGDYKITLTALDPYPRDKVKIEPENYAATFIISRQ